MAVKVSEGPASRNLFVNRETLIAEFLRRIHSPASNDVLFLYGEGGIGKSSLLDQFEDHYARHLETPTGQFLDPWVNYSALPPRELVHHFLHLQSHPLACARINFWERALGKDPRDAFFGLQVIRKRLKLPAPLFQSACVLYVHRTEGLTREWMAELFPGDRADFAVGLIDQPWTPTALAGMLHLVATGAAPVTLPAVSLAALVRGLWGISATLHGPALAEKAAKRKLGNAIEDLASYKPDELFEELPRLLAEDINTSLNHGGKEGDDADRVVLLFDAYDRFIGSERHLSSRDLGERDRWFRRFLKALRLDRGAVVVVTGQEPPQWNEEINVDARAVDYLAIPDARLFLCNAAVEPEARREGLIGYASVATDQVQPFFLALLVDAHRLASGRGAPLDPEHLPKHATVQQQQKAMIDRLLAAADVDLRHAINSLAACRSFDWNVFHWLGEKLAFANFRSRFDILTGLSCVRRAGVSVFVMHSLIRRFLGGENAGAHIHEACREYYSGIGNSVADTAFHEWFLDKQAATRSWIGAFRVAASPARSDHAQCAALLAVRRELPAPFALEYADEVGDYLARLSRYDEAESELSIATDYWIEQTDSEDDPSHFSRKGLAFERWAHLRVRRSHHAGAEEKYGAAVEAFDQALALSAHDPDVLCQKGNTLWNWADLRADRSDHVGADEMFGAAVEAYDRVLTIASNHIVALHDKGRALMSWATSHAERSDYKGAEAKYRAAVEAHDRGLALAPSDPAAFTNKGMALRHWADLRAQQSDHAGAEEKYETAVQTYNLALALAPNYIEVLGNKGNALTKWAELRARLTDHAGAEEKYGEAVEAFNRVLTLAPSHVGALHNKGSVLRMWAHLRAQQGDHRGAEQRYGEAVEAHDRALALAPNSINTLNNRGTTLREWADVLEQQGDHAGAEANYGAAVEAYNRALTLAPNDSWKLNNKGAALRMWAHLKAQQGDHAGAEQKYREANEFLDQALVLAPTYILALNNKGEALWEWAAIRTQRGDYEDSEEKYSAAADAFDRALVLAPNEPDVLNHKGSALRSWAGLRAERGDYAGAEEKYVEAVEAHDRALALAPNHIGALSNKGDALRIWADLRVQRSDHAGAEEKYNGAVSAYDRALALAPSLIETLNKKGVALQSLSLMKLATGQAESGKAIEYLDQALIISRDVGDRNMEGSLLGNLGICHYHLGDLRKAIEFLEQQLLISREIADRSGEGHSLGHLGLTWWKLGDADKGIAFQEDSLRIAHELGDRHGEGVRLTGLGHVYSGKGDVAKAKLAYQEAFDIADEIGDKLNGAHALYNLAGLHQTLGDLDEAIGLMDRSRNLYAQCGSPIADDAGNLLAKWRGQSTAQ